MATFLPLTLPHLASTAPSMAMVVLGDLLLLGGLVFSVWSVGHLSCCLSVRPQARTLVDRGPYQFVRHPLYSGEIVAMLGLALALGGTAPLLAWLALTGLQCYRAAQEEQLLRLHVPNYEDYMRRTARVLPGVF
jgi:protein-S-isoprenylcysteine O-methyltransferase Ste14